MFHVAMHFIIPVLVALAFYRSDWRRATVIMIATMVVDVDHLLADPIYDPARCSIGFHPLHTLPAILMYVGLFAGPLLRGNKVERSGWEARVRVLHLSGLGLLIHMILDWIDCFT